MARIQTNRRFRFIVHKNEIYYIYLGNYLINFEFMGSHIIFVSMSLTFSICNISSSVTLTKPKTKKNKKKWKENKRIQNNRTSKIKLNVFFFDYAFKLFKLKKTKNVKWNKSSAGH